MANRRMFSIKIIDSAKFLKMPSSSRLLYYDLGMRADDDGIVEAFNVLRMTGATEDDLRVLTAKGYIKILNDDLVTFITDWNEHNKIRADRKVDSIYKDLLLQIIPEVKLLESKPRADRKTKNSGTSNGQPKDGIGKDRIGKDKLVQDRIGKDKLVQDRIGEDNNKVSALLLFEELGFGSINQIILEDIELLSEEYTEMWVSEALKEANDQGVRTMKYVKGILKNWKTRGFKAEKPIQQNKYNKTSGFNNFEGRDYAGGYGGLTYEDLEEQLVYGMDEEE
ncbi:MAG: DnaD domain protein [Clostridium sp.]|uniref:DnaD domain protein n=1 Tax=Clostridium sp. TaxID=1506 RepID=UPI00290DD149|nr:DnaD domain protein [Clostridium sp.]MDU6876521.1 DnaD domain protein [Clostridium sp.]MDU6937436.1 DnaD domain protein [Clostridium sp.]